LFDYLLAPGLIGSTAALCGETMQAGLIGGIGITHLTVYDQRPAPDGRQSGCAHVHAVTDEAYFVLSGTGALELHDLQHGFRSIPLAPGSFVQFAPGTVHRAVNVGGLTVLTIMGNAGLAERGDARIWFGLEADGDPDLYRSLWELPAKKGLEGALERRDRSVAAYMRLLELWERDRDAYLAELDRFVKVHARTMEPLRERFQDVVAHGPAQWLKSSLVRIDGLPSLATAPEATMVAAEGGEAKLGMCGLLRPLDIRTPV
jgi:mannose-6-phosphate isomerase-like protein (cupin superfamily)